MEWIKCIDELPPLEKMVIAANNRFYAEVYLTEYNGIKMWTQLRHYTFDPDIPNRWPFEVFTHWFKVELPT